MRKRKKLFLIIDKIPNCLNKYGKKMSSDRFMYMHLKIGKCRDSNSNFVRQNTALLIKKATPT